MGSLFEHATEQAQSLQVELSTLKASKEDDALKAQNDVLKAQLEAIQATLDTAQNEIKRLMEAAGEKEWHAGEHQKTQQKLLRWLAINGPKTDRQVTEFLAIPDAFALHHLWALEAQRRVFFSQVPYTDISTRTWKATLSGIAWLAERDDLK